MNDYNNRTTMATMVIAIGLAVLFTVGVVVGITSYFHKNTNAAATALAEEKDRFTVDLSDAAQLSAITDELEDNPILAVVVAENLSKAELSDGTTVAELNPWIEDFQMKLADGKWTEETDKEYEEYVKGLEVLLYRFYMKTS